MYYLSVPGEEYLFSWVADLDGRGAYYFRIVDGSVEHGANNGCYHWHEPDESKPNCRVVVDMLPYEDEAFDVSEKWQRRAVDHLMLNLKPNLQIVQAIEEMRNDRDES